jgi:N-acetylmuramoyl-L-alanine amidase
MAAALLVSLGAFSSVWAPRVRAEERAWVEVRVPGRAPVKLPARLLEGARYVSSLELLRALGVEGEWHPGRGELLARVGRMPLRLRAGSRTLEYGGRRFRLARPPRRASEGLLVPEEFIGPLRAAFIENAPPTLARLPEWTALRTVIVDPGHGGDDRGAEGPGGVLEKDVTLAVARRLAERLRAELGCRTVLTRTSDRAVSLPERTAVAVRESGDLFLSLHANASPSPSAAGYETFIVSAQASDAEAERLAEIENAAGGPGPSLLPTSFLQQTLQDLIHSESMEESQRLAALVQEYLGAALRGPNRGVKQAPFWVLAGVEMPAVLIELGFMTNLSEGKQLADPVIQSRMAEAIADAVAAFRFELDLRHGVTERSRKAAGE